MLIGSERYCIYLGRQYVERSSGQDYVTIRLPSEPAEGDFPDATEFGGSGPDAWVELPTRVLTRRWREWVHGLWRGAEVEVSNFQRNGKVMVYCQDRIAAERLGMPGSQYDGWSQMVPIDEIQLVDRVIKEYPVDREPGTMRGEDVTVTRIPFEQSDDVEG